MHLNLIVKEPQREKLSIHEKRFESRFTLLSFFPVRGRESMISRHWKGERKKERKDGDTLKFIFVIIRERRREKVSSNSKQNLESDGA